MNKDVRLRVADFIHKNISWNYFSLVESKGNCVFYGCHKVHFWGLWVSEWKCQSETGIDCNLLAGHCLTDGSSVWEEAGHGAVLAEMARLVSPQHIW